MPDTLCQELDALEIHVRDLLRVGIETELILELIACETTRLLDDVPDHEHDALRTRLAAIRFVVAGSPPPVH